MEFTHPRPPGPPVSRNEALAWAGLVLVVGVSRFAVAPTELFEWDSANYALAMTDFDVFEHRPHPPGYPLFTLLLRLASAVLPLWAAFVAVNALMTAGVLAMLGGMARTDLGPRGAWLLGLVVATCPLLWLHGAASTAYVAEAFCAVGTATTALAVLRGRLSLTWAAVLWGLLLGIRPNGAVTLAPLMLYTGLQRREELVRATTAGAAVCSGWLFPMVAEAGGPAAFIEATRALSDWQFKAGSALGGNTEAAWRNATMLTTYVADALNVGLLLVLALFLGRELPRPTWKTALFWACWLGPSCAYYVFHHLPKSGYALTVVPGVMLAIALGAAARPRLAGGVAVLYATVNAALFVVAVPNDAWRFDDAPELIPERVIMLGDYSVRGLLYRTRPQRVLAESLADADPETDVVVFLTGSHELHRLAMVRHPEFELVATFAENGLSWSNREQRTYGEWQLEVLRAPKLRGTDVIRSDIRWDGRLLQIEREGDQLRRPLEADRMLLIIPCDPCEFGNPGNLVEASDVDLGAGFSAVWLRAPAR